jgi:hypothetical protein
LPSVSERGSLRSFNPSALQPTHPLDALLLNVLACHTAIPTHKHDCICRVAVARCAYCMQEGESLYSIAGQWRTKWLDVWSGNPHIKNPGTPPAYSELRMGPIYRAMQHDSVRLHVRGSWRATTHKRMRRLRFACVRILHSPANHDRFFPSLPASRCRWMISCFGIQTLLPTSPGTLLIFLFTRARTPQMTSASF